MSVNFCFAIAKWPKESFLGCGFEPRLPESIPTIKLGSLNPTCEKCSPEMFKARLKSALELPDHTDDIWRWRTIYSLAQNESLVCINFIPKDPSKDQIAHVMRTQMSQEEIQSYHLYCHDLLQIKYLLPVEQPTQVFDLSTVIAVEGIEGSEIASALDCFSKDSLSQGLALTFDKAGTLKTYIWLKP